MDEVRGSDWDGESKRGELDRLQLLESRLTERARKQVEDVTASK